MKRFAYILLLASFVITSIACIKKEFILPASNGITCLVDKLVRIKIKMMTSANTVKVALVGDSTSDLASNAISVITYMEDYNNNPNDPLYGFDVTTQLLDFGLSGRRLATWNSNPAQSEGRNALKAANVDLIIFSMGINDVRINSLTKNQLKTELLSAIDSIIKDNPQADIILRMPNCFCAAYNSGYVQQGSYASITEAAQAQTLIMYNAYKEVYQENIDRWTHVEMFSSMDIIFGTNVISCPLSDHADQIHPTYSGIVRELVKMFGYYQQYDQKLADIAWQTDSLHPWLYYNLALQDTNHFRLIYPNGTTVLTAATNSVSATRCDFNIPPAIALTGINNNDIFACSDFYFFEKTGTLSTVNVSRTRLTQTLIANTSLANGSLKIYRKK